MKRLQLNPGHREHSEKDLNSSYKNRVKGLLTGFVLAWSVLGLAAVEPDQLSTAELSARYKNLIQEYRCPKCQNQNLADSDSPISGDLRREIRRMLEAGRSDREISNYLVERYGEFVLYRPRLKSSTYLLWLGPVLLLLSGGAVVALVIRRQASPARGSRGDAAGRIPLDPREEARLRDLLGDTATQENDDRDRGPGQGRSAAPR